MRECKIHVLSCMRGPERQIINVLCDARPSTNSSRTFCSKLFFFPLFKWNQQIYLGGSSEASPDPFHRKKVLSKTLEMTGSQGPARDFQTRLQCLCVRAWQEVLNIHPTLLRNHLKWELKMARHLLFSLAATVDSKEDSASDLPCAADTLPLKTLFNSNGRSASSELTNPQINTTPTLPQNPRFLALSFLLERRQRGLTPALRYDISQVKKIFKKGKLLLKGQTSISSVCSC